MKGTHVHYTTNPGELRRASLLVVAVPTPVDHHKKPDLSPVIGASVSIGQNLTPGAVVVYESTVYPGVTQWH